jgi:uncharacterized protein YqjF (DUF2071 family)
MMPPKFLSAEWRNLLMINWEVPPGVLLPYLPPGTRLDTFDGRNFVSIVAFQFLHTRLLGIPIPFHRDFEEVNLRFYVTREVDGVIRRGVVFVKELVPRFWIAATARVFYNEPYKAVAMRHHILHSESRVEGAYEWCYRDWHSLRFSTSEHLHELVPGSLEQFIAEHYWGYCVQRDKRVVEYRVEHPAWSIRKNLELTMCWDPSVLYGEKFGAILTSPYHSAFLATGSPVSVYWPIIV